MIPEDREIMKKYDIVMIGHVSKDIILYGSKEERVLGGAVTYSSIAGKRSGASVLVITKVSPSDRLILNPLKKEGVDMVIIDSSKTTSIKNLYETEDMERRKVTLLSQAQPFRLEEIPKNLNIKIFYLAGLFFGEIPSELIFPLAQMAEIAIDAQGIVRCSKNREIMFQDWESKEDFLPKISYLKTDAAEAEILTGEGNRERAAKILNKMGAREVMVTHNKEVIICCNNTIFRAPFTPENLSGRTGRGDTCFASYLTWRLSHEIEESVRYAAALTSIKMEIPGPFKGSIQDVLKRVDI